MIGVLKIRGRGVLGSVRDGGEWGCWWEVGASVSVPVGWFSCVSIMVRRVSSLDTAGGAVSGTPSVASIRVSSLSSVLVGRIVISEVG